MESALNKAVSFVLFSYFSIFALRHFKRLAQIIYTYINTTHIHGVRKVRFNLSERTKDEAYMSHKYDLGALKISLYLFFGYCTMNISLSTDMCLVKNVSMTYIKKNNLNAIDAKSNKAHVLANKGINNMKPQVKNSHHNVAANNILTPPESRPGSAPVYEYDTLNIDHLDSKANILFNQLRNLQAYQLCAHISTQLKYLIKHQRRHWNLPCPDKASKKHKRKHSHIAEKVLKVEDSPEKSYDFQDPKNVIDVSSKLYRYAKLQNSIIDPDATDSSSSDEDFDHVSRHKNEASKKWEEVRAGIISRCVWLFSRVSSLEQSIRTCIEIHKKLQATKKYRIYERSKLASANLRNSTESTGDSNSTNSGSNTPAGPNSLHRDSCARTLPIKNLHRRKLFTSEEFTPIKQTRQHRYPPLTRPCSCWCQDFPLSCVQCHGTYRPLDSTDLEYLNSPMERVALLDPSFHPVISLPQDIPLSHFLDASVSQDNKRFIKCLQKRFMRLKRPRLPRPSLARTAATSLLLSAKAHRNGQALNSAQRNSLRLRRKRRALALGRSLMYQDFKRRKKLEEQLDDDWVAPFTIAPLARFEKLVYKDIPIPRWRIVELPTSNENLDKLSGEEEDTSDEHFIQLHLPYETEERKKNIGYVGRHINKGGGNNLQPPNHADVGSNEVSSNKSGPFIPRNFPLSEEEYQAMLQEMPAPSDPPQHSPLPQPEPPLSPHGESTSSCSADQSPDNSDDDDFQPPPNQQNMIPLMEGLDLDDGTLEEDFELEDLPEEDNDDFVYEMDEDEEEEEEEEIVDDDPNDPEWTVLSSHKDNLVLKFARR